MQAILSAMLLLPLAVGFAGSSAGVTPRGSVEHTLDSKEQELEQLYASYWQIQYQLELGDTKASDKEVEGRLRDVINDPAFLETLKAAHFTDPALQRRRQLFLEVAADLQISTNTELATRVESIRKDGSAIRYKVGGKLLDRPELDNVLGHAADRDLRRQAWYAQADLTTLTGDRIREVIKMRNELGGRYAAQKFSDFMLQRRSTNRRDLANWFQQIKTSTEPEYRVLLSRMQRELRVEQVEPWDLQYFFFNADT